MRCGTRAQTTEECDALGEKKKKKEKRKKKKEKEKLTSGQQYSEALHVGLAGGGALAARIDLIVILNSPAAPSPQIPTVAMLALAFSVGQTSGCSLEQQMLPWSVHSPVKSDHLFVY
eukprot:SAG31_NODE_196_length_20699_cov_103.813835_10_plen_117_part_00